MIITEEKLDKWLGPAPEPTNTDITRLDEQQEANFQTEYAAVAKGLGLSADPDDPRHFYDYRGLFKAEGALRPVDNHFPSKFKLDGHPNLIVDGVDTRTGRPVVNIPQDEIADPTSIDPLAISPVPQIRPFTIDQSTLLAPEQLWTPDRVQTERTFLERVFKMQTPERNGFLSTWWRDQGQFIPPNVLQDLGVTGGEPVPTTAELVRLHKVRTVEHVQAAFKADPLAPKQIDPFDRTQVLGLQEPQVPAPDPKAVDVAAAATLEDLTAVQQVMEASPEHFTEAQLFAVDQEIRMKEVILPFARNRVEEDPVTVLQGTQFIDAFTLGIPNFLDRHKALREFKLGEFAGEREPLEERPGDFNMFTDAVSRIRSEIVAGKKAGLPRFVEGIKQNAANIAASIIQWSLLPTPSKLKAFDKLPAIVKSTLDVGSKAALRQALVAPRPEETVGEKVEAVGEAGLIGASIGFVLGIGKATVSKIKTTITDRATAKDIRQFKELLAKDAPDLQAYIETLPAERLARIQLIRNDAALVAQGKMTQAAFDSQHGQFQASLSRDAVEFLRTTQTGPFTKAIVPSGFRPGTAALPGPESVKRIAELAGKTVESLTPAVTGAIQAAAEAGGTAEVPDLLPEDIGTLSEMGLDVEGESVTIPEGLIPSEGTGAIEGPVEGITGVIKNEIAGSGRTGEDLELKPEFAKEFVSVAMLRGNTVIKAQGNEVNHAQIAERLGFPDDLVPGFIDNNDNFVFQFEADVPSVQTVPVSPEQVTPAAPKAEVKAPPVKPVLSKKIVSPEEAGPFRITFKAAEGVPATKVIVDPKLRKSIQASEIKLADLKTRLKQERADKKVAVAKATVVQVEKQEAALSRLKERGEIKLVETKAQATAKLKKIFTALDFKQSMRNDVLSMIQAIDRDLQPQFINRAFKIGTLTQRPATAMKKTLELAGEIQAGIDKFEQRSIIGKTKKLRNDLLKAHKFGNKRLGALPSPQREQILDIIDNVDFVKLTEGKQGRLEASKAFFKKMAGQIASGLEGLDAEELTEFALPARLSQDLRRLEQANVNDMTTSDIQAIYDSLTELAKQAELKKSLLVAKGKKPLADINIKGEIAVKPRAARKIVKDKPVDPAREREKKTSFAGAIGRFGTVDNYHLDTLTDISTVNDSVDIVNILDTQPHAGQRKTADLQVELFDNGKQAFDRIGFKGTKQLENKSKGTLANSKVKLTDDALLSLEMATRDEGYLDVMRTLQGWEIEGTLFLYPDDWGFAEKVAEMNRLLADTRKNKMLMGLADYTNRMSNGRFRELIDETANLMFGHPIARVENHWTRPRVGDKQVSGGKDVSFGPEQKGLFKPRFGSFKPIKIEPWSQTYINSVEVITFFNGMGPALRNARALANSQEFQRGMIDAGREAELKNIITLLRRIQGVQTSKAVMDVLGSKAREFITVRALGFRVSTTGTQTMSAPAFAGVTGRIPSVRGVVSTSEAISRLDMSPLFNLRWRGRRIGVEIGTAAAREAFDIMFFGKSKIISTNTSMKQHVKGDQLAMAIGYNRYIGPEILEVPRNGKNLSLADWNGRDVADIPEISDVNSRAFVEYANKRMEYAARRSQPMWDMLDRSVNLSDPSITRRAPLMFRTALEAQQNLVAVEISRWSKSPKKFNDGKRLWYAIVSVMASALAVAMWKRSFKWGIRFGSKKVKEQLGIFQFDEEREISEVSKDLAVDASKNLVRLSPFGQLVVFMAEKSARAITPDGYNWRREPWTDPLLDFSVRAGELVATFAEATYDLTLLDNFVEEVTQDDIDFNDALVTKIIDDWVQLAIFTMEMGSTIGKVPLTAPTQEFVKPVLRDSQIKIIREVGFDDVDDPQEFSQRIFDLYELRSDLKKKQTRLSKGEQRAVNILDSFARQADKLAGNAKEMTSESLRKAQFRSFELGLNSVELQIDNLKVKETK